MAVKVLTAEYEALLDDVKTGGLYLAVAIFAGGKKHWGNNSLGAVNFAEFRLVKLDG